VVQEFATWLVAFEDQMVSIVIPYEFRTIAGVQNTESLDGMRLGSIFP